MPKQIHSNHIHVPCTRISYYTHITLIAHNECFNFQKICVYCQTSCIMLFRPCVCCSLPPPPSSFLPLSLSLLPYPSRLVSSTKARHSIQKVLPSTLESRGSWSSPTLHLQKTLSPTTFSGCSLSSTYTPGVISHSSVSPIDSRIVTLTMEWLAWRISGRRWDPMQQVCVSVRANFKVSHAVRSAFTMSRW